MLTTAPAAVPASPPTRRRPAQASGAWWAPVILLAATLVTYHAIAYGPGVPGGYDTQTYFFAYRQAVAEALRAGRFPLWDTHIFLGAPLFANVQAAVLYPPNILYLFWSTPQAIAASLILHVWWAGWGMAILCRRTFGVPWLAATVGGAMFGLSGFMSAQAGHVNQVDTAAWLPWLLLCLDMAWQRRSAPFAALAAVVVAVQFLAGHTQESYFILCVTLAWGIWRLLQQRRSRASLVSIVAVGAVALAGGIALAGVQLIPTLELTGQSIRRTGLTPAEASSFSLRPDQLAIELLPGFAHQPDTTEHVAYVGVMGMLFALIGAVAGCRRPGVKLLYLLVVLPLALAFGQYDPLWKLAFHVVPGFAAFRVPARWLYITTFGLAALGAIGVGVVWEHRPTRQPRSIRAVAAVIAVITLVAAAAIALGRLAGPALLVSALTAVAFLALLATATTVPAKAPNQRSTQRRFGGWTPVGGKVLLCALTVLELVSAASWLALNVPVPPQVYSDQRQTVAYLRGHPADGRVLSIAQDSYSPGDAATITQIADRTTGPASVYATLVSTKFQDILTPNLSLAYGIDSIDGYDGGILPLASYIALKQVWLPPCAICANPDAILRQELAAPPPTRWLQLLGVGAVIADRLHDFNQGGIAYDMNNTLVLPPGASAEAGHVDPVPATTVGLVTDVADAVPAPGTPVAEISLTDTAGRTTSATLTSGVNTAAAIGASPVQPATTLPDPPNGHAYLATIPLPDRRRLRSIQITSLLPAGNVEVRAISLNDALTHSATTVVPSSNGSITRVLSGDVNIYHIAGAGMPAFLALRTEVAGDDNAAAKLLQAPEFPLLHDAVLSYPDFGPRLSLPSRALRRLDGIVQGDAHVLPPPPAASATTGSVTTIRQGNRISATVTTDAPAYLILKQAWYPGWRATVDGKHVPIYRADLALQAVPVPAGRHTVVVDYRPASFLVGGILSGLAAVALLLVSLAGWRWDGIRRGDRNHGEGSDRRLLS